MRRTIITFNIWDLPLWFVRGRDARIAKVADFLAAEDADIVCLQESFDVRHRLSIARRLGERYAMSDGHEETRKILGVKTFDMTGGLVVFSKFPIVSSRFFPFSRLMNVSCIEFLARKGFLEVVVETPEGPLRVIDIHAHKVARFGGRWVHLRQVERVLSFLKDAPTMPTVFAGDFNEDQMTRVPEFRERFRAAGFAHPGPDDEPLAPSYRKENPLVDAWPNRIASSERDDYVLLRGILGSGWNVVHYAPYADDARLSDHDPVMLVLEKK